MKLTFQRGKHLTANYVWIDFISRNIDILTAFNKTSLTLVKVASSDSNKYRGKIFGLNLKLEQIHHENKENRGNIRILADLQLPFNLGKTYTIATQTYCKIDRTITSMDFHLDLEMTGLMAIYIKILYGRLEKFINELYCDIERTAAMLERNGESEETGLTQEQIARIKVYRDTIRFEQIDEPNIEGDIQVMVFPTLIACSGKVLLPDKRLLTAEHKITIIPEAYESLKRDAINLSTINNSVFIARGNTHLGHSDVEFRQEAYRFGHLLYQNYFAGDLTGILQVLLSHREKALLRLEVSGALEELPWEAMHDGNDFLSLRTRFARSIGITMPRNYQERSYNGILLVGADSRGDLPGVKKEVENIGAILTKAGIKKVEILTGEKADRQNVIKALSSNDFKILHFSGHSIFDEQSPPQSYLELYQGMKLYLHEIGLLIEAKVENKPLDLVFLNSCESGRTGQDEISGKNLSISKIFRSFGAETVIGMLWNVSDDAATQVASIFYTLLLTGSKPDPVEAMRETRCRVALERAWSDGSWLAPVIYI